MKRARHPILLLTAARAVAYSHEAHYAMAGQSD